MIKIRGFFLVVSGKSLTFAVNLKKYYHDETTKDH
jgi:hypothetical protein